MDAADDSASEADQIKSYILNYTETALVFNETMPIDELVVEVVDLAGEVVAFVNSSGRAAVLSFYDNSTSGLNPTVPLQYTGNEQQPGTAGPGNLLSISCGPSYVRRLYASYVQGDPSGQPLYVVVFDLVVSPCCLHVMTILPDLQLYTE